MIRFALLLGLFGLQGCLYMTAAHSTAGRAYVIRNELVGSSYWNCYANSGDPVCYQVSKVDKDTPIAALDSQPNGQKQAAEQTPAKAAEPVAAVEAAPAPAKKPAPAQRSKQASAANTRKPLTKGEN